MKVVIIKVVIVFYILLIPLLLLNASPIEEAKIYKAQCEHNNFKACMDLANSYYNGKVLNRIIKEYREKHKSITIKPV